MSDYYESEIEPTYGMDEGVKTIYAPKENNSVKIYYYCEKCGKKGRKEKLCCGAIRTKAYNL